MPLTWWRPGWMDVLKCLGWRWLLIIPAGLIAILLMASVMIAPPFGFLAVGGLKLILLTIGIIGSSVAYVLRRAIQARKDPFCVYCGYSLVGLPDNYRCPECGRPYTWHQIEEYRRDPQWFIQRWKMQNALPPPDASFEAGPRRRRSRDGTS